MRFFLSRPKTTILVIIAAALWFIFSQYVFGANRPERLKQVLTQTFRDNNRDYFGGKLPPTEIVLVPTLKSESGENLFGSTVCLETENGVHCTVRISQDYNLAYETAILTLDHEMCHIKLWGRELGDHGSDFQACMQEGAALGEFKNVW